jgi:hypothetical protein
MTRTVMCVVVLHLLAAARWWHSAGPATNATPCRRTTVLPVWYDDGCAPGVSALWRGARTAAAMCLPHAATLVGSPPPRLSAQTTTADDVDVIAPPPPQSLTAPWPEAPLGLTDGLRPGPVGESQRQHRKTRRRRCRVPKGDDQTPWWWATVLAAVLGMWMGPAALCTLWAWVSAAVGLWLLATGRHFWWPVCAALSINYWCATAWIAWTVSPTVGAALAVAAIGVRRGSPLLFPGTVLPESRCCCASFFFFLPFF